MTRYLPWVRLSVWLLAGVFLVWGGFAEEVRAGCLGTVHCNTFSNNGTDDPKDDWCDPMSFDNVSCEAATTANACNVTYDWQNSCDDKRCYDSDTCSWSGGGGGSNPTPTTPASCGNGTCGSGESCSNCPADCGVCTEVTWAYITVTVYGDNGLQAPSNRTKEPSSGSNTCKGYEFASSSTGTSWDAYGNCQNSWLLDMAKTDKSMNISGIDSKYSDCQVKLNNTVDLSPQKLYQAECDYLT